MWLELLPGRLTSVEGPMSFIEVTGNGGLGGVEDKRPSEAAQSTGPDVRIGDRKNLVPAMA